MRVPAIRLPANPFWEVFKTFGRDELTGGVIALVATGIIEGCFYLYNSAGSFTATQMLLLALSGPILEKIGFFFWHVKEARDTFNSTPTISRKPLKFYIRQAIRGGAKTLMWDVLLHDPLYILLMLYGMKVHPTTPAWLLVPIAFGIAVVAVAILEVAANELRYKYFTKQRKKDGYELERYLDARLFLDPNVDTEKVIHVLKNHFLPEQEIHTRHYEDVYYIVELPEFNGRQGRLRIRSRDAQDCDLQFRCSSEYALGDEKIMSVQYIYSRTVEDESKGVGQFRFFPRKKDKHYRVFDYLPNAFDYVEKEAKKCGAEKQPTAVCFTRRMVYDRDALFIAVDSIDHCQHSFRVVELKVYPDKLPLLVEAMHFVMHTFPAMQTTDRKIDLIEGK